jgi:hypothetical protein
VDSVGANNSRWAERAMALRNMAQQCYLLIGLTDDPRLKTYLLEIGLGLEHHVGSIESELAASRGDSGPEPDAPRAVPERADQ